MCRHKNYDSLLWYNFYAMRVSVMKSQNSLMCMIKWTVSLYILCIELVDTSTSVDYIFSNKYYKFCNKSWIIPFQPEKVTIIWKCHVWFFFYITKNVLMLKYHLKNNCSFSFIYLPFLSIQSTPFNSKFDHSNTPVIRSVFESQISLFFANHFP